MPQLWTWLISDRRHAAIGGLLALVLALAAYASIQHYGWVLEEARHKSALTTIAAMDQAGRAQIRASKEASASVRREANKTKLLYDKLKNEVAHAHKDISLSVAAPALFDAYGMLRLSNPPSPTGSGSVDHASAARSAVMVSDAVNWSVDIYAYANECKMRLDKVLALTNQ